jgi:hypothetical protein
MLEFNLSKNIQKHEDLLKENQAIVPQNEIEKSAKDFRDGDLKRSIEVMKRVQEIEGINLRKGK